VSGIRGFGLIQIPPKHEHVAIRSWIQYTFEGEDITPYLKKDWDSKHSIYFW
jgi:hypothetical protein